MKFPSKEKVQEPEPEPETEKKEAQNDESKVEKNDDQSIENDNPSLDSAKLLAVIMECKELIEETAPLSTEDAKRIAAKNYYCQNPSSLIQKLKRKMNEDTSAAEKRQKI